MVVILTPEKPLVNDCTFNNSIIFTSSSSISSPNPHACDFTRLICSSFNSVDEITSLQSEPKPVLIP